MILTRWLVALGCLCLLAVPALAQPTVQDFSNPGVKGTNYAEYGTGTGFVQNGGPPGAANFYRLTQAGTGNTNNVIALDLTSPGKTSHVVGSSIFAAERLAAMQEGHLRVAFLFEVGVVLEQHGFARPSVAAPRGVP